MCPPYSHRKEAAGWQTEQGMKMSVCHSGLKHDNWHRQISQYLNEPLFAVCKWFSGSAGEHSIVCAVTAPSIEEGNLRTRTEVDFESWNETQHGSRCVTTTLQARMYKSPASDKTPTLKQAKINLRRTAFMSLLNSVFVGAQACDCANTCWNGTLPIVIFSAILLYTSYDCPPC